MLLTTLNFPHLNYLLIYIYQCSFTLSHYSPLLSHDILEAYQLTLDTFTCLGYERRSYRSRVAIQLYLSLCSVTVDIESQGTKCIFAWIVFMYYSILRAYTQTFLCHLVLY